MLETIKERFDELIGRGSKLIAKFPLDEYGPTYYTNEGEIAEYQSWLASVSSLLFSVVPDSHPIRIQLNSVMSHPDLSVGVPTRVVQKAFGILNSAKEELEKGLLRKIEYLVAGETFDNFLDHAEDFHKGNKKIESSVLASVVLEDTMKKIAAKHELPTSGISLEALIDALVKKDIFTPVKAKRLKGYAAVRNHALHAEWDHFDIKDVGELIKGSKELIENYL